MYAAIRRGKANPGSTNELVRRIQDGMLPTIRNLPGFVAYTFVNLGNDEVLSINVFETQEAAEESNRLVADWARRQNLAGVTPAPPETSEGEVLIHVAKQSRIAQRCPMGGRYSSLHMGEGELGSELLPGSSEQKG